MRLLPWGIRPLQTALKRLLALVFPLVASVKAPDMIAYMVNHCLTTEIPYTLPLFLLRPTCPISHGKGMLPISTHGKAF